jgi:hypothetical protein
MTDRLAQQLEGAQPVGGTCWEAVHLLQGIEDLSGNLAAVGHR